MTMEDDKIWMAGCAVVIAAALLIGAGMIMSAVNAGHDDGTALPDETIRGLDQNGGRVWYDSGNSSCYVEVVYNDTVEVKNGILYVSHGAHTYYIPVDKIQMISV